MSRFKFTMITTISLRFNNRLSFTLDRLFLQFIDCAGFFPNTFTRKKGMVFVNLKIGLINLKPHK